MTLTASDRPNDGGEGDLESSQFQEVIAVLGLTEIGPSDRKGPTTQSPLDRFLCSTELLVAFPLAEVTSLPRSLLDHMPIVWAARVGSAKSTYFKLDRSWLRDGTLKNEILEWWGSRLIFRAASKDLCTKFKDLRHHLFACRQQIRSERTRSRDDALARVQALDDIEDSRPLLLEEVKEQETCQDAVGSAKSAYFKLDRSWLRDGTLKNEILERWGSRFIFRAVSEPLRSRFRGPVHQAKGPPLPSIRPSTTNQIEADPVKG